MVKVLTFLDSKMHEIEPELNKHMDKYEIVYVWSTPNRLVFILKEKKGPGRPKGS